MPLRIALLFLCSFLLSFSALAQWQILDSLRQGGMHSIHFINADTGYIYNSPGYLRRTLDGGQNWDTSSIVFSGFIYDFDFSSPLVGYAVGGAWFPHGQHYSNAIFKTTDGGLSWDSVRGDYYSGAFYQVEVLNANQFFVTGDNVALYSADAGQSFDTLTISNDPGEAYLKVQFIDPYNGYVLSRRYIGAASGSQYKLYRSFSGGQQWQLIHSDTVSNYERDFIMTSSGHGMLTGDRGEVSVSSDFGQNWQQHSLPAATILLYKLAHRDGHLYALGSDQADTSNNLYHSVDWGQSWDKQYSVPNSDYLVDLSIPTISTGYFCTYQQVYKNDNLISLTEAVESTLQVFPNPVDEFLTIRLAAPAAAELTLYNLLGQVMDRHSFNGTFPLYLNLAHLQSGIYLLQLRQGKNSWLARVVKN